MKKNYENPTLEIIEFDSSDIILTSGDLNCFLNLEGYEEVDWPFSK